MEEEKKVIKAESYTLRDESGGWLGQVVLTNDGMFACVTEWGNLSYAWRAFGEDFKKFLIGLNVGYFGSKMVAGLAYTAYNKKVSASCMRFAEKILPALQSVLIEETGADAP